MAETKHTPECYVVDDVEGCLAIAAESDGEVVAYLARAHQQTNARSPQEMQDIATLFAAAPDMLQALLDNEAFWAMRAAELGCLSEEATIVRATNAAAIAKATSGTQADGETMFNGLTKSETNSTPSVYGLTKDKQ
jgi:hypothetical protein